MSRTAAAIAVENEHCAHNYHPLPVVLVGGEGAWVQDIEGRRYLDCLAGYSALNFGHRHPRLVGAAQTQLNRLTLTSRAFHNDQLGPYCEALAEMCGLEAVVPMNTGAEAVETAIKIARKWGYERRGVAADQAEIVTFAGNFHGRTTTIVSFSDDPVARGGFGPFTPGFVTVPYGNLDAVAAAIGPWTVAVLIEPIQGEAGVILPPPGFLAGVADLCREHHVLLVADEIQSGLGRSGATFACQNEGVVPDLYVLGKALGGGIIPSSAVVGRWDVMGVLRPGEHGSTFGGNPLAAAIGREVIVLLEPGDLQRRSALLGARVLEQLHAARLAGVREIRGRGLWWAIEFEPDTVSGRVVAEALLQRGLLAKDTHTSTIRFAPPLTIEEADLELVVAIIIETLTDVISTAMRRTNSNDWSSDRAQDTSYNGLDRRGSTSGRHSRC